MGARRLLALSLRTPGVPLSRFFEVSGAKLVNRKRVKVPYAPLSIHFCAIRKCNLNCLMCDTQTLKRKDEEMAYPTFCKLLDQIPNFTMRRVVCEGTGEPLLHNDIIDMFAHAKKRGFITGTFTNGTLINEVNVASLLKSLDEITISLDGATKETYEKIRVGAKFEDVIDNINLLVTTKRKTRAPTLLKINFTANKLNCHEISEIISLASRLGVETLEISMLREMHPWISKEDYTRRIYAELTCSFFDMKKYIPQTSRTNLIINEPGSIFPGCNWPFRACYITDDGFVTPCCIIIHPEVKNFGNIFQTPLAKIWNNQQYQEFRQRFISDRPPEICTKCQTIIT